MDNVLYTNISLIVTAYLLGAIPTSVWVGKIFYKKDVRDFGSGNAGATNTFRVLGKKAGIPVLIFDILKGWTAVYLSNYSEYTFHSDGFINLQVILVISAVIGHIFPIYAGFRGGKGVATLLGAVVAIHPYSALIAIIIFLISLLISKYVSLSSMLAGIAFSLLITLLFKETNTTLIIFSIAIAVLLLFTHRKNIKRLIKNEESKTYLFKRKNK